MSEIRDGQAAPEGPLPQSRRALLIGAGLTCAAVLTGCTTYDASSGFVPAAPTGGAATASAAASAAAPSAAAATSGAAAPSAAADSAATSSAPTAKPLTSTADVPVGGGTIIDGPNIVVTQPQADSFKAFTAVCTHQGCIVSTVSGGTINCPCHGSKFSIKDGSVVNGPAASPLAPVAIKVEGTSIFSG